MEILKLFKSESSAALKLIVLMAVVSGAANGALVALINAGADAVFSNDVASRDFILFVIALVIFLYTKAVSESRGKQVMEMAMSKQRIRIFDKIRNSELIAMERLNQADLISKMSRNIGQILQASDSVIYGFQAMIMLIFCSIYLFIMSGYAFAIVMVGVVVLSYVRYIRDRVIKTQLDQLIDKEGKQSMFFSDILDGFKETKINVSKSEGLFNAFSQTVNETTDISISNGVNYIRSRVVMQAAFFIILAVVVFVMPRYVNTYSEEVMQITAVVLFIVGYLSGFVQIIPVFARTNAALNSMSELESMLDKAIEHRPPMCEDRQAQFDNFKKISVDALCFDYPDQDGEKGFSVGPLDLQVGQGEIVFIVGGNGSGKSTFLKLFTGLYLPASGCVKVDDHAVGKDEVFYWREMFAIIFSDFHLFNRCYGFEHVDEDKLNELIRTMKLDRKVRYVNGAFSTLKLSTGQRKRLALIIAMMEDKPLYVFDEWASDQDQYFRKFFYETVLQDLKARGKTVVAVTHDDMYWHVADRVIRLDYGKIVSTEL